MARKKQEIALQTILETQEEWEEMLSKEGMTVVDVYQEWAGPCKAMVNNFRRVKNELGDDLLHFTVAKADSIDALERYRGKCEPCFLFFAGGSLVSVIRGANSPVILRTLTEQLAYEHKVLEGNAERKEVVDTALGDVDPRAAGSFDEDDDEGQEQKKGVSVAILKPNVVMNGKVDEIIEKMKESGIDILEKVEKTMTEEEAKEFYAHQSEQEFFPELISYMTSGPSVMLVITKGETGEGIIEEWRELLGPPSVEEARSNAPDSLRAKYGGEENYANAMHGSDSTDRAMTELAFFFPDFNVPVLARKEQKQKKKIQRTLALIRPDAMRERKDEILAKIKESGFTIAMQKEMQLTKEQAAEFYKEHEGQDYFDELTTHMSSGPLLALALAREEAVSSWRDMLGPKEVDKAKEEAPESLRAQFTVDEVNINPLHGSDSAQAAEQELNFFFPMQQTVAVVKPDAYQTKDEIMAKIKEAGFHVAAKKETELTEDIAKQFYKDLQDKEYFGELTEHMTAGPTLFMVLSREDAVDGWRSVIGPTDPEKAKEENPESLRAKYGQSIKANAVHGSSTAEHAKESIKLVFGDLDFNPDGTVKEAEEDKAAAEAAPAGEGQTQESQQQEAEPATEPTTEQTTEPATDASQAEESEQKQETETGQKTEGGSKAGSKAGSAAGSRAASGAGSRAASGAGSRAGSGTGSRGGSAAARSPSAAQSQQGEPAAAAAEEGGEQKADDGGEQSGGEQQTADSPKPASDNEGAKADEDGEQKADDGDKKEEEEGAQKTDDKKDDEDKKD